MITRTLFSVIVLATIAIVATIAIIAPAPFNQGPIWPIKVWILFQRLKVWRLNLTSEGCDIESESVFHPRLQVLFLGNNENQTTTIKVMFKRKQN